MPKTSQDIPSGFLWNIPSIPAKQQEWQEWTGNGLGMDWKWTGNGLGMDQE